MLLGLNSMEEVQTLNWLWSSNNTFPINTYHMQFLIHNTVSINANFTFHNFSLLICNINVRRLSNFNILKSVMTITFYCIKHFITLAELPYFALRNFKYHFFLPPYSIINQSKDKKFRNQNSRRNKSLTNEIQKSSTSHVEVIYQIMNFEVQTK